MKNKRHILIMELIDSKNIETQEDLALQLKIAGLDVTQATVSRDIKELNLVKVSNNQDGYKYARQGEVSPGLSARQLRIFADTVLSIDYSGSMIVIKTMTGSANAAAEALDGLGWDEFLGTIAGDNTIFMMVKENTSAKDVSQKIRQLLD
ncbi:MAG: arginine repressor [Clostridiales bacterium]|nr:arginine repressor [Clostridiales bacterium]